MLLKTHIAINLLFILLFLQSVSNKIVFFIVAVVATAIPDLDSGFSTLGKSKIFWLMQQFTKHRGFIHSMTLCIVISIVLAVYFPTISLAFFLGYSLHLLTDAFTKEGIQPFWPYKKMSQGFIRTGSIFEDYVFVFFALLDVFVLAFVVL